MSSRLAPWLLCIAYAYPVHAQTVTSGSISGYVYDQQRAALVGVTITATSPDVPGTRQTVSTDTGAYRLPDLPPGTYTLTAEHPGFARYSQQNIRVGAGLNLGLEVVLPLADVAETVEVRHDPPMLEVLRPGQTINISGDFQRDVPLTRRRDWAQFMELTPGVIATQTQTFQNYSFHGSNPSSHVLQLDGMDVMPAISNSNVYTNLNADAIADVQIKTSVADSSVPLGTGAVANIVTHSGTNSFRGTTSLVYQNRRWNDGNSPTGTTASVSLLQPDLSLGGPLKHDRAWFFTTYRHIDSAYGINRSGRQLAVLSALVPGFEPFDNSSDASLFSGKVTYRTRAHEVTGAFQYDRTPTADSLATDGSQFRFLRTGGPWSMFRITSVLSPSLVSQVAVSYNTKNQFAPLVDPSLPSRVVYERVNPSGGRLVGTNALATLDSQGGAGATPYSKAVISADVSYERPLLGSHNMRFGFYFQRHEERNATIYANGGAHLIEEVLRDPNDPALGSAPFRKVVRSPDRVIQRDLRARDTAAYLQDLWHPHARVTIAAGVRFDVVFRYDRVFDRRVQHSLEVGPRFGATVAVDAASRQVVHVAAGRVHDALPLTAVVTGTSTATVQDTYDVNLDGVFETAFLTPGATQASANRRFDDALHQPHVNEMTMGYRRQLAGQTAVDIMWIRRTFRDQLTNVEVNGLYDGLKFLGYQDETQDAINLFTNNRWNWPVYTAISAQVTRRTARVQFLGSYTRQWQRLHGTWQPNDPYSRIQPTVFPNDRLSSTSRDHVLRVAGATRLPWTLSIGADYTLQSGAWSGPITTELPAPDPQFGPQTVRLSSGRVVSNPLATTTRFAFATRGDGQLQAKALHIFNLRVAKDVVLASARVQASIDVFNVTNSGSDQGFSSTNLASAAFGLGVNRQLPRAAQLGLRFSF